MRGDAPAPGLPLGSLLLILVIVFVDFAGFSREPVAAAIRDVQLRSKETVTA